MAGQQDPTIGRLTRAFFARPVLEVAPELLGCTVSHAGVTVRLTEVEAYDGSNDPGSHAFSGQTPRTWVMFGKPGGLYVYFVYGMHWCANLVCGPSGTASAVLLRAGQVVQGIETARARRPGIVDRDLARGPARLAMTLGLARDQNGLDTVATDSPLVMRAAACAETGSLAATGSVSDPSAATRPVVGSGPRVGVSGPGGDAAVYPWRFWLEGEATVSPYRPGTVRPPKPANRPSDP